MSYQNCTSYLQWKLIVLTFWYNLLYCVFDNFILKKHLSVIKFIFYFIYLRYNVHKSSKSSISFQDLQELVDKWPPIIEWPYHNIYSVYRTYSIIPSNSVMLIFFFFLSIFTYIVMFCIRNLHSNLFWFAFGVMWQKRTLPGVSL